MDSTNFTDFIKESDNGKNSNQEAKVLYHAWRLLTPNEEEIEAESQCFCSCVKQLMPEHETKVRSAFSQWLLR
jgi:hypothetical protein